MPGFDRTGPWSEGSMTGGRRGLCTSKNASGHWYGRASGPGRGVGRGFGSCYWRPTSYQSPYSPILSMDQGQEIEVLKSQAKSLNDQLEQIEGRLSGLKKKEN